MTTPSWPFNEPSGEWDKTGRTWSWRAASITGEQAQTLNGLAPRWSWTVREDYEAGNFLFMLTRWSGAEPADEVTPKRRKHRWSEAK